MKSPQQRNIQIWADWEGMERATKVGTLISTPSRGKGILAFEYDNGWLKSEGVQILDPALCHFSGPQYPTGGK